MAGGYPLQVDGTLCLTSEALYQACRFPHLPDVQRLILDQRSPMAAKMKSKHFRNDSRTDWETVKTDVMEWCLSAKLACNWDRFSALLSSTQDKQIVEESRRDNFWGAIPRNTDELVGYNVLGQLLMDLRDSIQQSTSYPPSQITPLSIPNFMLLGERIRRVEALKERSDSDREGRALLRQMKLFPEG